MITPADNNGKRYAWLGFEEFPGLRLGGSGSTCPLTCPGAQDSTRIFLVNWLRTKLSWRVSGHYPLWAEFELDRG